MTHREAMRAWGRSMFDVVNGILFAIALATLYLKVQVESVELRLLISTLAIAVISYRTSYKTINAEQETMPGRCFAKQPRPENGRRHTRVVEALSGGSCPSKGRCRQDSTGTIGVDAVGRSG